MALDNDIVSRVYSAKGNSELADSLISDYLPFIKSETSKFTNRSMTDTYDDEVSIAMIAFHRAVETYSEPKGNFLSFASVVIKNSLIDFKRKESRHSNIISLDIERSKDSEGLSLMDSLIDPENPFAEYESKSATVDEIQELSEELKSFGVSLTDIADNCPKQKRTLKACQKAVAFCVSSDTILSDIKSTGRLPMALIVAETDIPRKTLERHRKYILAITIIYSNGYAIIRGHLKQVYADTKGGGR